MSSWSASSKRIRTVNVIIDSLSREDLVFERRRESRQRYGLGAVRAGRDHANLCAGLLLDKVQVILGQFGELIKLGNAFSGLVPPFQSGVDGLDGLEATDIGGNPVRDLAIDLVGGAYRDLGAFVHHVHLGDDEPLSTVNRVGVAEEREIEPAAAARTTGDGTVLLPAGAEKVGGVAVDLGGEWSLAHAGDVGLGDSDDGADFGRADAGSCDGSASGGRRTGHEGVGSVVDIEQSSLGALEHHLVAVGDGGIEQL